jgi:hypothetical protein
MSHQSGIQGKLVNFLCERKVFGLFIIISFLVSEDLSKLFAEAVFSGTTRIIRVSIEKGKLSYIKTAERFSKLDCFRNYRIPCTQWNYTCSRWFRSR